MKKKKASEIAMGAIDTIEKYGWRQGSYGNKEVGFCLIGAVHHYAGTDPWDKRTYENYDELLGVVNLARDMSGEINVADWNDDYGREKPEVVHLLAQVANEFHKREM